jgi:hypothetical protein
VPTIQSWITGSSNQFVQVTLNKETRAEWGQLAHDTTNCSSGRQRRHSEV